MNELVIHEDELRGVVSRPVERAIRSAAFDTAAFFEKPVEIELLDVGETPCFIAAFRRGRGEVAFPCIMLPGGEPSGENSGRLGAVEVI